MTPSDTIFIVLMAIGLFAFAVAVASFLVWVAEVIV